MIAFRCVCTAMAACSLLAACASAPISISARAGDAAQAAPVHASVADAVDAWQAACEEHGWTGEDGAMASAIRWVGRMTGQAGSEAPEDAVARYLRINGTRLDAPGLPVRLQADIQTAWTLAGAVDNAALDLIAAEGGVSRSALTSSLGEVEAAMTQSREVVALFDRLIAGLPDGTDTDAMARIVTERDLFVARSDALRDRADTLARLRRDFDSRAALS